MKFKPTIVLSVVLVALCSYLYFIELPAKQAKKKAEESTLFSFLESDMTELVITGDGQSLSLVQLSGNPDTPWKIAQPINAIADGNAVDTFASNLAHLKIIKKIDDHPADLTPFGLNPPAYSVRITLKGFNNNVLDVGDDGMLGNDVYVRVGNTVYLVESGIKTYLAKSVEDWRRQ